MSEDTLATIGLTALGTLITTIVGSSKVFFSSINSLNLKIDNLSQTIATFDKNLAVQSTILDSLLESHKVKGG